MAGEQVFERYELKYWVPRRVADQVVASLASSHGGHMVEDEIARRAGATQINTSLYFDSPRFTFLEQHVYGSPDRIKLRVRFYGEEPGGPCFFEIKRRQSAVVMKKRAIVLYARTQWLLHDLSQHVPPEEVQGADALEQFQYLAMRTQAEPKLLVRARRLALRAVEPGVDVRVTVDTDIAWQPPRAPDVLVPRPDLWRMLGAQEGVLDGRALIEVKFRNSRPWWLADAANVLGDYRVSFSKYVASALEARADPFFRFDAA
ncbi:MAG: polyphosphate polymerase domain-containing protein [Myxococcaceae bacterium]